MKNLKCLFIVLIVGLLFYSCEKDKLEFNDSSVEYEIVNQRSYNQLDCGFVKNFCESQSSNPPIVARVINGGNGVTIKIADELFEVYPYKLFDGSQAVIINTGNNVIIGHNSESEYLNSKNSDVRIRPQLSSILSLDYNNDYSMENVTSKLEGISRVENIGTAKNPIFNFSKVDGGYPISSILPCSYSLVSKVENFINVFFDSEDQPHIKVFIEEAYAACPPAYIDDYQPNIPIGERCLNYCIDPRCVVDNLLDIDAGLSEFQKRVLMSRYLQEVMDLTNDEQNWLTSNDQSELVTSIYDGLLTNQNLGRCNNEDCGLVGGYHEFIKQSMAGQTLTTDETTSLLEFFSVMSCDNPEIYGCFREAQQFPDSDVATFLNEVISMTQSGSNFLIDGCDDLAPYTGRWEWLATFNPLSVQEVSDKLDELGEEYWIQTINNATNVNWWWEASPTVNMDFFGITITTLPNKPFPPFDQFTAEEFFDYLQDNFTTSTFLGDGNDCHSVILPPSGGEFVPYSGAELFNWTGQTPITSTFEINMFDDGSVMCTDFNDGENWTFSTLNAPGWLEGDSYDGFHPVSGNRQFGIIDNGDGTYTFYTSGVDRLSGWWHVLGGAGTSIAFDKAEELWKCFLDQIKTFVEGLGGEVSADYDCTNVRPDLDSLKELLKQGCGGDPEIFDEFPCHQSSECP